ncbi:Qat anti-phage system ATPase QatA [Sinorhizobium sp. CCBAU 05631]|uniref:Qat anti-phage system ATPase QatA n=1 Tax=Sinorhizobium sp. CCBAU 05631 TaxID=794846 RepID=UPI0004B16266|nr:Qat anti-phage system ATPase QatA [Sinorhizobium sp. CCBAU 05631]ASY58282.1 Phage T7 exclusion protein [Sinorhizobium sp. CCBAU 05631]
MNETSPRQRLGFISDHETRVDLLRNKAIASTIIEIIGNKDPRPLTIGVHGYWGAGKSSVLEMIADHDFDGGRTVVIRFNGWQFEGFEDAKIALIEGVVDQLAANKTIYHRAKDQIIDVAKRINWLKVAKKGSGLLVNALTGLPSPDQAMDLARFAWSKLPNVPSLATQENLEAIAEGVQDYIKETDDKPSVARNIREFHDAFAELIDKAGLDRLIVLVDDLDRCLPETAVETLEAIRLFVMLPKTAFVIGADERMIQYAVAKHFDHLPSESEAQDYPRAYLEKLIQVPFRIPAMGEAETRTYLTLLVVGSLIGDQTAQFGKLLAKAEEFMSSPWLQTSIGDREVSDALKDLYTPDVVSAVNLADRIAPILASGTAGNPRNVKRFMNSLTLRLAVAEARGFGSEIDSQVLAKLMLAEQFATSVFTDIAKEVGSDPQGKSSSLAQLEERVALHRSDITRSEEAIQEDAASDDAEAKAETEPSSQTAARPDYDASAKIDAWLALPYVETWAGQEPWIGRVDLRPYLFVVNDVRNFTLLGSALDPALQALADNFAKGGLYATQAIPAFEALSPSDQRKVFDELRSVILRTTNWASKPVSLEGMVLLVNKVAAFEARYLELLSHMPPEKLGRWAASGHDRAVKTEAGKARLGEIRNRWATTGSDELRAAVKLETRSR